MARRYVRRDVESDEESTLAGGATWRGPLRLIAGVGVILALVVVAFITINAIADADDALGQEPSAVQVIQVYTEGLFYAVIAIGAAIGVYIATRADD